MNFIFFGSPQFAAIILEKLIGAGLAPAAIVCNPDKPVGRKKIITPPPTKLVAIKNNITALQPIKLDEDFQLQISKFNFDFFLVAAYAKIIPEEILTIPRQGTIGVHPSLLPEYRGPTPIQSQILQGDEIAGTTLFLIDEKVDHGPVLANRQFPITNIQYKKLEGKLAETSADLLIETLPKFIKNGIVPQPQNHTLATFTKKFTAQDGFVEFNDLTKAQNEGGNIAVEIDRKIRALNPEPGAWTVQQIASEQKRVKLIEANLSAGGKLQLTTIQVEGKLPAQLTTIMR